MDQFVIQSAFGNESIPTSSLSISSAKTNNKQTQIQEKKPVLEEFCKTNQKVANQSKFGVIDWNGKRLCGYIVSKKGFQEHQWEKHRKWLTVTPKDPSLFTGIKSQKPEPYTLFYENKEVFIVPRGYGYARWGVPKEEQFSKGEDIDPNLQFTGTPLGLRKEDPPQILCINKVLEQFGYEHKKFVLPSNHYSLKKTNLLDYFEPLNEDSTANLKRVSICIISLPCGYGKTFCAISIIFKMGKKAIVFLNRENLLDNWKEDIQNFLPSARIGIVKGKTCDYKDKDIVLCMVQSAISHPYPDEMWESFHLAVIDECHHECAKTYCRLFELLNTKNILGLSATPYRRDNLDHLLNWFMGPIIVREKRIYEGVLCSVIYYSHSQQKEITIQEKPAYAKMISRCCKEEPRNQFIAQVVAECFLNPQPRPVKRKILIVSERSIENHLGKLKDLTLNELSKQYQATNKNVECVIKKLNKNKWIIKGKNLPIPIVSVGFIVGGMKEEERAIGKSCDIIFSTLQCVEEGFNLPRLDTLVIASCNRNDIEQVVGRILRPHPEKNIPKVIEIVDDYSFFKGIGTKHLNYYKEMGYHVLEIQHKGKPPQKKTK